MVFVDIGSGEGNLAPPYWYSDADVRVLCASLNKSGIEIH
jgi:hypothetical protein